MYLIVFILHVNVFPYKLGSFTKVDIPLSLLRYISIKLEEYNKDFIN